MKKSVLLVAALFIVGISMSSCNKDYKCQCSKTYTTGNGSSTTNYSNYTYNDNKVRANDRCKANEATSSDLFGNYSINCSIQ